MEATAKTEMTARSFCTRADSVNPETRSVEAILVTQHRVRAFDMKRRETIEEILLLDGLDMPDQLPLVDTHPEARLGHALEVTTDELYGSVREIRRERNTFVGTLHFAADPASDLRWQKCRDGHLRDVSLGYVVSEATTIPAYQRKSVNGREYRASARPLRVATQARARECSLTVLGADARCHLRTDLRTGRSVAEALNDGIRSRVGPRCSREYVIRLLSSGSGFDQTYVRQMLDGRFPGDVSHLDLASFAGVLQLPVEQLMGAALADTKRAA